jgi:hypothetical protein
MYLLLLQTVEGMLPLLPPELDNNPFNKCPACHKCFRGATADACFKACHLGGRTPYALHDDFDGSLFRVKPADINNNDPGAPEEVSKLCSTNYAAGKPQV